MQKISSYLYPNRIELLADLAGFSVEFTNVYQRNVKIYNGIDNTIEFDIKNADQKRIDLSILNQIELNVMDAGGAALPNSPYTVTPLIGRGLAEVIIPQEDLADLSPQYLKYSVSALKNSRDVLLYANTRFGAVGTIELVGDAMPTYRDPRVFNTFVSEIDIQGNPIYHSSAIPAKFYESISTDTLSFEIQVTGFVGTIWLEATTNDTINLEAFRAAGKPFGSWNQSVEDGLYTGVIPFASEIPINDYSYFRVSYQTSNVTGIGAAFTVTKSGTTYSVSVRAGGTGYAVGALLKVPGTQLGGVDGVNDLVIMVRSVYGHMSGASSYNVSSITAVTAQGVATDGTGTFEVSGFNYSGKVDSITVS